MITGYKHFVFTCVTLVLVFSACSKKDAVPDNTNIPDTARDTLSAGWTRLQVLQDSSIYQDVVFSDNLHGYLVSDSAIYKTQNAGASWTRLSLSGNGYINVAVWDNNHAAINNFNDTYIYTKDGSTYNQVNFPSVTRLSDMFYQSPDILYLSSNNRIWKSTDGGQTMNLLYTFSGTVQDFYGTLCFSHPDTGWFLNKTALYKTVDGGLNWSNIRPLQAGEYPNVIRFFNSQTGIISLSNRLIKTTNGGASFQDIVQINGFSGFADIAFINENLGYLSRGNLIFKTTDGGLTWEQVVSVGNQQTISEIHFTDANHGWACGTGGLLLRFNQ